MFGQIERYVFRRAAVATLVVAISLTAIVWIIQAFKQLDIFASKGQTVLVYLYVTTLSVPVLLLVILPIALLLAAIYTVNSLNSDSELVVINASGASSMVLVKPFMALALICSVVVGLIAHQIGPQSIQELKRVGTKVQADMVALIVREGEFNEINEGLTFHVAKRGIGGLLKGIVVSDTRDEDTAVLYTAHDGMVERSGEMAYLVMENGEIHRSNVDGTSSVISYATYVFNLADFSGGPGGKKDMVLRPKERVSSELIWPDPEDPFFKKHPNWYSSQLHLRTSETLYPFAFVLIVLVFAGQARSTRQNYTAAISLALATAAIARGIGFWGANSSRNGDFFIFLMYAIPITSIATAGLVLATNRQLRMPKTMAQYIERNNKRIAAIAARIGRALPILVRGRS